MRGQQNNDKIKAAACLFFFLMTVTLLADADDTSSDRSGLGLYMYPSYYMSASTSGSTRKYDSGFQFTIGAPLDSHWRVEALSELRRYEFDGGGYRQERGGSVQEVFEPFPNHWLSPLIEAGGGLVRGSFDQKQDSAPLFRGGIGFLISPFDSPFSFRIDAVYRREYGNKAIPNGASRNPVDMSFSMGLNYDIGAASREEPPPRAQPAVYSPDEGRGQSIEAQHNCTLDKSGNRCVGAPDADSDGVPDSRDKCPDTPPNAVVDSDGCLLYLKSP